MSFPEGTTPLAVNANPLLGRRLALEIDSATSPRGLGTATNPPGAALGERPAAVDQPNVNAKAATPASRNSISNCRLAMGCGCRIS